VSRLALALMVLDLACQKTVPSTTAQVVREVRNRLAALRTYDVALTVHIDAAALLNTPRSSAGPRDTMNVSTQVTAALPDRMRVDVRGDDLLSLEATEIFDGKTMWCRISGLLDQQVRLDQRRLGTVEAPFDVGFDLRGHGLEQGQDYIGTVRKLLDEYEYARSLETATVGTEPCYVLRGHLDVEARLAKVLADPQSAGGGRPETAEDERIYAELLLDILCSASELELYVSRRDLLPRRWTFGGMPPAAEVVVTRIDPGAAINPVVFRIPPEALGKARDVTTDLMDHRRSRTKLPRSTAERVSARVRAGLRDCARRGRTPPSSRPEQGK
jgi:hypothetical protein